MAVDRREHRATVFVEGRDAAAQRPVPAGVRNLLAIGRAFGLVVSWLEDALVAVTLIGLAGIGIGICYDVVARRYLGAGIPWVVEISEYWLVYLTFLSAPWILRHNGHVREEFVVERLPRPLQRAVDVFTNLLVVGISALLAWFGCSTTADLYRRGVAVSAILGVPKWIPVAPVGIGFALVAVEAVRAVTRILGKTHPET